MPRALYIVNSRPSAPEREDEYNDWYTNTHLPEVLDIPGITAARRFKASDVARYLEPENGPPSQDAREMHAVLERAGNRPLRPISPTTVSWRLKKLANAPARVGNETLVLRRDDTSRNQSDSYCVKRLS